MRVVGWSVPGSRSSVTATFAPFGNRALQRHQRRVTAADERAGTLRLAVLDHPCLVRLSGRGLRKPRDDERGLAAGRDEERPGRVAGDGLCRRVRTCEQALDLLPRAPLLAERVRQARRPRSRARSRRRRRWRRPQRSRRYDVSGTGRRSAARRGRSRGSATRSASGGAGDSTANASALAAPPSSASCSRHTSHVARCSSY